jgi:hypothetical protein
MTALCSFWNSAGLSRSCRSQKLYTLPRPSNKPVLPDSPCRPSPLLEVVSLKLLPQQERLNFRIPFLWGAGKSGFQLWRASAPRWCRAWRCPCRRRTITKLHAWSLVTATTCRSSRRSSGSGRSWYAYSSTAATASVLRLRSRATSSLTLDLLSFQLRSLPDDSSRLLQN